MIAYISIKKRLKTWSRPQTHYCMLGGDYFPLNLGALDLIHDRFRFLLHNNFDMIILQVLGKFRVLTSFVSTSILAFLGLFCLGFIVAFNNEVISRLGCGGIDQSRLVCDSCLQFHYSYFALGGTTLRYHTPR